MSYYFSIIADELIDALDPKRPFVGRVSSACKVETLERFGEICCQYAITPALFTDNIKRLDCVHSVRWLFFDFDTGVSVADIVALIPTECDYIILASQNHMRDKGDGKGIIPRFHVLIASEKYTDVEFHKWSLKLFNTDLFQCVDRQCLESSRFFAKHREILHIQHGQAYPISELRQKYNSIKEKEKARQEKLRIESLQKRTLPTNITDKVISHIIESMPEAIEGNGGDKECFKAACRIIKAGGEFSHFEDYNIRKCLPQFSTTQLQHKWKYANDRVGFERLSESFMEFYYQQCCEDQA